MSDFIYLCPQCGSCFSSETSLQEHDLAANCSQNHVCLVCHKVLKGLALLKRHVTTHQNLLHCCNICGELCDNKVDVFVHVTTSHKYGGKMICDLCSKTFPTSSSLKVHTIKEHAAHMTHVLQKWELFCNVHSSRNLCGSDALKDSFYPSNDCPLHPKEKESLDETNSVLLSNASTSNQSILLAEKMDVTERPLDSPVSALNELQIFLQQQSTESWYTNSTDHLSSSIRPSDILEQVQPLTENKSRLQEDQPIECRFCDTTFRNTEDYMLAHDGKDPVNINPHKKKPASQTRLQDLVEFRKFTAGNTSRVPSKKCIKGQLCGDKAAVIHPEKNVKAENQYDQIEPKGTLLEEIPALTSQIKNKNSISYENANDQIEPNDTLLAEISALTLQIQNRKTSDEKLKGQLEPNDALFAEISALTIRNQNKNASA